MRDARSICATIGMASPCRQRGEVRIANRVDDRRRAAAIVDGIDDRWTVRRETRPTS